MAAHPRPIGRTGRPLSLDQLQAVRDLQHFLQQARRNAFERRRWAELGDSGRAQLHEREADQLAVHTMDARKELDELLLEDD